MAFINRSDPTREPRQTWFWSAIRSHFFRGSYVEDTPNLVGELRKTLGLGAWFQP
jgi:hypothetical protein